MICLDNTDVIEGGASVDAVVDYQIHGLVGTTFAQLAAGVMGTTLTTVLYAAGAAISIISIILVNKHSSAVEVTLSLDPADGGNPRYLIPKTISLGAGYSLHTDGAKITVMDASGNIQTGAGGGGDVSADEIWNAAGDLVQGIGVNAATILAIGAANLKLFVNAGCDAAEWAAGMKIGTFTIDVSTTGTQEISGVGFKPSSVIFIGAIDTTYSATFGFDDGTLSYCMFTPATAAAGFWSRYSNSTASIALQTTTGVRSKSSITTLGADGFTITKAKDGLPTGTVTMFYFAFR